MSVPGMTYRGDLDALRAQRDSVREELQSTRDEIQRTALAAALAKLVARIRHLDPSARDLLTRMKVAAPCEIEWDLLSGGDRARQCPICAKSVYDVRGLTGAEASTLLASLDEPPCPRLYQRRDGTVTTTQCGRAVARRRVRLAIAAVIALCASLAAAVANTAAEPVARQRTHRERPCCAVGTPGRLTTRDTIIPGTPPRLLTPTDSWQSRLDHLTDDRDRRTPSLWFERPNADPRDDDKKEPFFFPEELSHAF
jgi:hypothetical protein